jgi:hypothetical protein
MSNTLTNLIPDVYAALDVVSRELVGIIPAAMRDGAVERAAIGQTVRSFVAPATTSAAITPGVTAPDTGDQVIGNVAITIDTAEAAFFRWRGEESRGINNGGPGVLSIQQQQIAQALRTLTNKIELRLCTTAALGASRAFGTANTTPFASTLTDINNMRKILDDNGAPASDRHYIMNTTAGLNMRNLTQLTNVNQSASSDILRQGELTAQPLSGFALRESGQIVSPVVGTSSNTGTTDTAGYAVGATAITMAAAGTGTILAGDFVTFTGDTNKYGVKTGVASLAAGGVLTLNAPGLVKALAASNVTATVVAQSHKNLAFSRNAIVLASRLPALPDGGDMAVDRTTIVDVRSGLVFELAMYPQYKQMLYEISGAWGATVIKSEHICVNLGEA